MSDVCVKTATASATDHTARRRTAPLAALVALALALLTASASEAAVGGKKPPPGRALVAAYSFDEGGGSVVGDASGSGNSGAISGAAWTTGHSGGALSFNGSSNWVTVADSASLDLTQMTLEAWVQPASLDAAWSTIVTKESSGDLVYGLFGNSASSRPAALATVGPAAQQTIALGSNSLPLSSWSYVAATYDGNTLRFYVNGTAVASQSASGSIDPSTSPLRIGGNSFGSEWFHGKIDDLRIYDRALGARAIQSDMSSPVGGVSITSGGDTQAPSAPTNVRASATANSIALTWSPSTDNVGVAGYTVYNGSAAVGSTAATSYTLSGLTCGTTYALAVNAYDAADNQSARTAVSAATSACPDTQPPTPPSGLTATAATQNSLSIGWSASSDNVGVTGYTIYNGVVAAGSSTATLYTVSGLNCGTTYTFAVEAYDAAGNRSSRSSLTAATTACPVSDTQPPAVPSALAATAATQNSISIAWGASLDNVGVTGYSVYRGGAPAGSTAGLSYTVSGLSCGTSYTLAVDAFDAAGNHSAKASITASTSACPAADTQAPSAPTNVRASATANSIALTWSPSTDNVGVVGYTVYNGSAAVGSTAATSYTLSGLTCGTTYALAVEAYDAVGNRSAKTAAAIATTACADTQPPSAPGSVQTSQATTTGVTASWGASTDNVGVTGYGVYVNGALAGSTANTSYALAGLACGTTYTISVDAVDGAGNRSAKSATTGQTSACAPAGGGTLTWRPPTLVNPTTIQVSSPTTDLNLDPSRDYILKLPSTPLIPGGDGGIYINGGHNVVVIGGELYFDRTSGATEGNGRVAAIFNNTGTVHFEGLWAHGPGIVEGIQNYSSQTVVQVENCRFDRLDGNGVYHSDLFQFGAGKELRIDHFTGSSNVQGLFVTDMSGHVYANNVNINGDSGADILTWQGTTYVPWTVQAFYLHVSDGSSLGVHVWPSIYGTAPYQAQVTPDGSVSWPSAVNIGGSILNGTPPGGDFVPTSVAGSRYVSPGYAG